MEQLTKGIDQLNIQENTKQQNINIRTGVLYDKKMLLHKSKRQHVENPSRLIQILNKLNEQELIKTQENNLQEQIQQKNDGNIIEFQQNCQIAKKQDILLAHNEEYVNFVDNIWPENYNKPNIYMLDTYACEFSVEVAYLAAGATIEAIEKVINGTWTNAFAIVRPPGHHSGHSNTPTGFCYFNNVAIGAKYTIKNLGLKKVAIVDWDIHHGDGSQKLLEDDPSILQISLHRHDNGDFYPGISGCHTNMGIGEGKGFNLNFPWNIDLKNQQTARNEEYIFIFERFIVPILKEFQPELVLVSSGFDGCMGDPLGQCEVTQDGYAYMTHRLMNLMDNKLVVNLEGGYNLDEIPKAAEGVLRALNGENLPIINNLNNQTLKQVIENCTPNKVGINTYENCLQQFQDYWPIIKDDPEVLKFEQNCFKNIKKSYRYNNENKIKFLENDKICLRNFEDKLGIFDFYKNLKENQKNLFSEIEQLNEDKKEILFKNLFFGRENSSILRIDFGNNKNNLKKLTPYWKRLSFSIKQCIVKNQIGIPMNIYQWEDLAPYKKYPLNQLVLDFFNQNQNTSEIKQLQNNAGYQMFFQFLEQLLDFINNQEQNIIQLGIIVLFDNINYENSVFKIINCENENKEYTQNIFVDIDKGIQNLIQQLKEIQLKAQGVSNTVKKQSNNNKKK